MIHNHSSGKIRLLKKILAVCMVVAMIGSISITAFTADTGRESETEAVQQSETMDTSAYESEEDTGNEQEPAETETATETATETPMTEDDTETETETPETPETEQTDAPVETLETPETDAPVETPETPEIKDVHLDADVNAADGENGEESDYTRLNYTGDAAIYYLIRPDAVPGSNATDQWKPDGGQSPLYGVIDTTGATWDMAWDNKSGAEIEKNITVNVGSYVTSWPDGSSGSSWSVKKGNANFSYILDSIWDAYQAVIEQELKVTNLKKDSITEIVLTPFKISRNNVIEPGEANYENHERQYHHIDCTISVVNPDIYTARFSVRFPEEEKYTQIDAKNYLKGTKVVVTKKDTEATRTVGDITYQKGARWYGENEKGEAYGNFVSWQYAPTDRDLADGTVNFYKHYEPQAVTSLQIQKLVTGGMGDKSKPFRFQVSVKNAGNGNSDVKFKMDGTEYDGSASFELTDQGTVTLTDLPVGATITVTEDDYTGSGQGKYTTSCQIDGTQTDGREAVLSRIQTRENGHTIIFTNNKEAIPDVGIHLDVLPYILIIGMAALGAVLLAARRKRSI